MSQANQNNGILAKIKKALSAFFVLAAFTALPFRAFALPEGENIVAGSAAFDRSTTDHLEVTTSTDKTIINYDSFSIAEKQSVNFNQPTANSITLNRVIGTSPSEIFGALTSNGRLFVINTNGVLFGPNSRVDAPALVASTLDISDEDFLNGNYNFFKSGENAFLVNQGNITVRNGGYVCLLSQGIENQGAIIANLGTVVLASGEKMTLALDDAGDISVVIDEAVTGAVFGPDGNTLKSAITNSGSIFADGGKILLTAKVLNGVFDKAINNTGIIQANSVVEHNGVIELVAEGAPVVNTGTISAGEVIISAPDTSYVNIGKVTANGSQDLPDGGKIAIEAGAILQQGLISANSFEAGNAGQVSLVSEVSTILDDGSVTEAMALGIIGNGGKITIDSKGGSTVVNRTAVIDVSAGAIAGNAGYIEVSAFDQLGFYGILNGHAPPGYNVATVLFDPLNIIISVSDPSTPDTEYISVSSLQSATADIYLQADNDITLADDLYIPNAGTSLTLEAGRNIWINANLIVNGGITLYADADYDGFGDFNQAADTWIVAAGDFYAEGANLSLGKITSGGDGAYSFEAYAWGDITLSDELFVSPSVNLYAEGNISINSDIVCENSVNLHAYGSIEQADNTKIISGGSVEITGAEVTLFDVYFAGDFYAEAFDGSINVRGLIKSAGIDFNHGNAVITITTATEYGSDEILRATNQGQGYGLKFDLSSIPNTIVVTSAEIYYYLESDGGWYVHNLTADELVVLQGSLQTTTKEYHFNDGVVQTYGKTHPDWAPYIIISAITTTTTTTDVPVVNGYTLGGGSEGTIYLYAYNNVNFQNTGRLQTLGDVGIETSGGGEVYDGGAIVDETGAYLNIIANNLVMFAANGIGSSDALETQVNNLSAGNIRSGNIIIDNAGDLNITESDWFEGITNDAPGGLIELTVDGILNIEAPIEGYGDIRLYVTGDINQYEYITINQYEGYELPTPQIIDSSHPIDGWSSGVSNDPTIDISWTLAESEWDFYSFTANAGGAYTQEEWADITTNGGDLSITANNDISLTLIDAGNGDVTITSLNGLIIDNDLNFASEDYDIIGRTITLSATSTSEVDYGQDGAAEEAIDISYPGEGFSYTWTHGSFDPDSDLGLFFTDFVSGNWVFSTTSPELDDAMDWYFNVATVDDWEWQSETASHGAFYIDTTAPVITASRDIDPNTYGWDKGTVTISYTVSDGLADIDYANPGNEI
ncbi:MAG TPA: hypothetical protein DCL35_03055, partial [Candidatus Omnitrophica bacterium]|nr:hypothetical protein [Candidatus Omnitrophota bacterium]